MKNLKDKVSVIVPAYQEGRVIAASLKEIVRTFDDFGCGYEVIVMDDGSRDDTFTEALKTAHRWPQIKVKRNPKHSGKGRALKKAFRYASGRYIVFLDADLDLHPGQVQTLFDIMNLVEADAVIGSKFHPDSRVDRPLSRRIISFFYYLMIKTMFGLPVQDTQTGLKIFKREVLEKVLPKLLVKKFALDLELLALVRHYGYKIAEAPVVLNHRRRVGRLGLRAMVTTGWDTLAVFYRMYIMKYYDRPSLDPEEI